MKKFRFRFEAVLKKRCREEDNCKKVLGVAIKSFLVEESLLKDLFEQKELLLDKMRVERASFSSISSVLDSEKYWRFLEQKILTQKERVKNAQKKVFECQHHLAEAMKKRKMMEILKSKEYENYIEMIEKTEQKELDEFAVSRRRYVELF